MAVDLKANSLYTNRELSWLAFDRRVLALALRDDVPLLERLKFVAIAASNLDEFFMVRVGGLERARRADDDQDFRPGPDGLSLGDALAEVWQQGTALSRAISTAMYDHVFAPLAAVGVRFIDGDHLTDDLRERVKTYYRAEVHPCLTPVAVDTLNPFPFLSNGNLNLAIQVEATSNTQGRFERPDGPLLAVVKLPSTLPRFVPLPTEETPYQFIALEDVVASFVDELFVGFRVIEATPFRVTRASDLSIDEDDAEDLLMTIQQELRRRDRGEVVRLEVGERASPFVQDRLQRALGVEPRQVQLVRGLLDPASLFSASAAIQLPSEKDEPYTPVTDPRLGFGPSIFQAIRQQDILLHHPYESFRHVVDFLDSAASDPNVVAIKQTLYRTSGDSPIVKALQRAAESGKEVTALVELKARFDEANNISWAKQLEESGAHVVYGLLGLKTHSKMLLVTRRETSGLRRYAHFATGNYHPKTANLYTDYGLFTADEDITHDAMLLFNVLTGYAELPQMRRLVVAPFTMRAHVLENIEREIVHARAGRPSGIKAKMNSLVDGQVIEALYRASQAGVPIELVVRGICCLRPQVPGVSETIRVRSILDRFLEHARVFWWANGGEDELYLSSADWMPRNLDKRIEVGFPILDPALKKRIVDDIMPVEWADNTFSWELQPDGSYQLRTPDRAPPVRAQAAFIKACKSKSDAPPTSPRPEAAKMTRLSPAVRAAQAQRRRASR